MVKNGTHYTCLTYIGVRGGNGQRTRACERCPLHGGACPQEGQTPCVVCPNCGATMEPVFVAFRDVPHSWEELLLSLRGQVVTMSKKEILGLGDSSQLQGFQCPSCYRGNLAPKAAAKRLLTAKQS